MKRACLIDAGLSPRRTLKLLAELGLAAHQLDDIFLTHLDSDHVHSNWGKALPPHVRVRVHASHAAGARACFRDQSLAVFTDGCRLSCGAEMTAQIMAHDREGVAAARFDLPDSLGGGVLGFATDLGRVTPPLIDLFRNGSRGVDVLAIESNYCPRMQAESGRPSFLIHRITGGAGHLSNQQSAAAVRAVKPHEHVVLLHLSSECNHPELAAGMHVGSPYRVHVSGPAERTALIPVRRPPSWTGSAAAKPDAGESQRFVYVQPSLFDAAATMG